MSAARSTTDRSTTKSNIGLVEKEKHNPLGMARKPAVAYAAIAVAIFLLGFIPMLIRARNAASQRDAARHELKLSQLQNTLSGAAIEARRGDYEPARQMASDFFTTLRTNIDDNTATSALSPTQRERMRPLLVQRDNIITLLARNDPAAADRLSDLFVSYLRAINGSQT